MMPQIPPSPATREALHQQLADQARALASRYRQAVAAPERTELAAAIARLIRRCPFGDINAALWGVLDRAAAGQAHG